MGAQSEEAYKAWLAGLSPSDQHRVKLYEQYGREAIEADLNSGEYRLVGGTLQVQEFAHSWLAKQSKGA